MTLTNYNFCSTHFEIKHPTKINKEPDFESPTTLYDEIKRCAQTIPSNNGGGNYGNLGLVVTETDYQLVSITVGKSVQNVIVKERQNGTEIKQKSTCYNLPTQEKNSVFGAFKAQYQQCSLI